MGPPVYLPVSCTTAMGKPPFKASEGGHPIFFIDRVDFTFGEFEFGQGYVVLFL
jgi:hypothetical protein